MHSVWDLSTSAYTKKEKIQIVKFLLLFIEQLVWMKIHACYSQQNDLISTIYSATSVQDRSSLTTCFCHSTTVKTQMHFRRVAAIKQSRYWFHCQVKPGFFFWYDHVCCCAHTVSLQDLHLSKMCVSINTGGTNFCAYVCAHVCVWTHVSWNQGKSMERAALTLLCFTLRSASVTIDSFSILPLLSCQAGTVFVFVQCLAQ